MKIIPFFPDDPADRNILKMCQISGRCIFPKNTCIRNIFHYSFGVNNSANIYLNICQIKIGVISVFGPVMAVQLLALILAVSNQHKSLF